MQLLSKVFSVKMVYRQLITIILSIYKNFSLSFSVIRDFISYSLSEKKDGADTHFRSVLSMFFYSAAA